MSLNISAFFTFSNVLLKKSNCFRPAELNVIQSVNCNTFSVDCRHSFDIALCQFIVLLIKLDRIFVCIYDQHLLDPM